MDRKGSIGAMQIIGVIYAALVRYTDGRGAVHMFKSEGSMHLFPDPALRGQRVQVYYEDASFRRYYVDISRVLPHYIEH